MELTATRHDLVLHDFHSFTRCQARPRSQQLILFSLGLHHTAPTKPTHTMKTEQTIANLIKATIHRAVRESIAGVLVILAFAYFLQHATPGTAQYYGCMLILVCTPFILGVIWSHTLSYRLLRAHSAADSVFWREAFSAQARLLRSVPLWYLAPLCSGMLLVFSPTAPGQFSSVATNILVIAILFGGITWLNRTAAAKIDESAATLMALTPM